MPIRPATLDDVRAIAELQVVSWRAAYRDILPEQILAALSVDDRAANWRQLLIDGTAEVRIAEENGSLLGIGSFGHSRDDDVPRHTAEVYALYLDPSVWRRGIGRQLWQSAAGELAGRRFERLIVWVFEANAAARRFYEAMGCIQDTGASKLFERDGCRLVEVRYVRALNSAA